MSGFGFYLGVGFSVLGVAYTLIVLLVRGAAFSGQQRPYVMNGIALLVLGVSMVLRDLVAPPRWTVYLAWAVAGYLAVQATRLIMRTRLW